MRKNVCGVLGLAVLLGVLCALGWTKMASAEVRININLGPPGNLMAGTITTPTPYAMRCPI